MHRHLALSLRHAAPEGGHHLGRMEIRGLVQGLGQATESGYRCQGRNQGSGADLRRHQIGRVARHRQAYFRAALLQRPPQGHAAGRGVEPGQGFHVAPIPHAPGQQHPLDGRVLIPVHGRQCIQVVTNAVVPLLVIDHQALREAAQQRIGLRGVRSGRVRRRRPGLRGGARTDRRAVLIPAHDRIGRRRVGRVQHEEEAARVGIAVVALPVRPFPVAEAVVGVGGPGAHRLFQDHAQAHRRRREAPVDFHDAIARGQFRRQQGAQGGRQVRELGGIQVHNRARISSPPPRRCGRAGPRCGRTPGR